MPASDLKITALSAIATNPINVATFPIPMVDLLDNSMAASGTTKKVTVNQILGAGGIATLASATITGDLTVDTSTLKVDSANNRVGIGTASPATTNDIVGDNKTNTNEQGIVTIRSSDAFAIDKGGSVSFWGKYRTDGSYACFGRIYGNKETSVDGAFTGYLGFSTSPGGTPLERMRLDSTGNLGLGVTPSAWGTGWKALQFASGSSFADSTSGYAIVSSNVFQSAAALGSPKYVFSSVASQYVQTGGQHQWFTAASGTAGNAITFTQAMTLTAAGALGLGTTSPSTYGANLAVYDGAGNGILAIGQSNSYSQLQSNGQDLYINLKGTGSTVFRRGASDTESARFDANGNLLVGTTSSSETSSVGHKINTSLTAPWIATVGSATTNGNVTSSVYSTGAAAYRFYVGYGGTVFATSTTISAISDARLKENVQDIDVGLDAILALKPRKFDWKAGKGKDIKGDRGFIAQEFETVFPNLIDEWKDPAPEGEAPYKSVRQDLIPVLVKAVQELAAEVKALKNA